MEDVFSYSSALHIHLQNVSLISGQRRRGDFLMVYTNGSAETLSRTTSYDEMVENLPPYFYKIDGLTEVYINVRDVLKMEVRNLNRGTKQHTAHLTCGKFIRWNSDENSGDLESVFDRAQAAMLQPLLDAVNSNSDRVAQLATYSAETRSAVNSLGEGLSDNAQGDQQTASALQGLAAQVSGLPSAPTEEGIKNALGYDDLDDNFLETLATTLNGQSNTNLG